jgi:hypothetical protein
LSRLSELSKGAREYLPAFWPANAQLGRPDPIPMKLAVLTDDDMQQAIAAAHARLREVKLEVNQYTVDELETETSIQVLARACRDNDQPEKVTFAVDAEDLRRNTTPWERAEVVDAWRPWQERRNPLRRLTADERQNLDALVKKKDATTLRACGLDLLVSYMLTSDSPPSS